MGGSADTRVGVALSPQPNSSTKPQGGLRITLVMIALVFGAIAFMYFSSNQQEVVVQKSASVEVVSEEPTSVEVASSEPSRDLVRRSQLLLERLGFGPGPVDGILGKKTLVAVKAFQGSIGRPQNGEISNTLVEQLGIAAVQQSSEKPNSPKLSTGATKEAFALVNELAGKSREQVSEILGPPTSCEAASVSGTRSDRLCRYPGGKVDVIFVGEKADWITYYKLRGPFAPGTLSEIGLTANQPEFRNSFVIRWSYLEGMREVSMFPRKGGGIHYILVIANTLGR